MLPSLSIEFAFECKLFSGSIENDIQWVKEKAGKAESEA
ncbi:hypothetical protein B4098_3256 [Heyndrickxia coagulans]|jgi:hypothetical protein|uniref:Uncharacterized protein n=1 Tax=Heyndrickxia coagulans TaxID=1398 RepID=A0A150JZ79_HEYCO|nr:hypothetical protein B4098_3256 [Heyndrickxia coagulans]